MMTPRLSKHAKLAWAGRHPIQSLSPFSSEHTAHECRKLPPVQEGPHVSFGISRAETLAEAKLAKHGTGLAITILLES
jgi:hypothetical protein